MRRAWVKHQSEAARSWCAVEDSTGGCVRTYCRGRMSISDDFEIHDSPDEDEQCGGCVRRLDELERIERGLAEMRETVSPSLDRRFDLSGGES